MSQPIAAKCSERCGWVGWGRTGWRDATDEEARLYRFATTHDDGTPYSEERFRWRGNTLQFRSRLRDTRCPGCGAVGLDRARKLEASERRHALKPAQP